MAARLAAAVPSTSDVDKTLEQTASALEVMAPADPAPLHARGLVRLNFRQDVPGGRALLCRAADLGPGISAYQESCADALIAARELPEATKRLTIAYGQVTERADQCRIIDKLLQYAPDPEVALAPSSHLVVSYCRDRALRADLERRRQEEVACRRSCADIATNCAFASCAIAMQACLARCS